MRFLKSVASIVTAPVKVLTALQTEVVREVIKPAGDLSGAYASMVSGMVNPWSPIIDSALNVLTPFRLRASVDLPNPEVTLQGGTSHQVLLGLGNQSGGSGASGPQPHVDITGGLISSLGYDLQALRDLHGELYVLNRVLRKGAYPHPHDMFTVHLLVEQDLNVAAPVPVVGTLDVRVGGDGGIRFSSFLLCDDTAANERQSQIRAVAARFTQDVARGNPDGPFASAPAMGRYITRSVSLNLPARQDVITRVECNVTFSKRSDGGGASTTDLAHISAVEIRIDRSNDGVEETLHRFVVDHPKTSSLSIPFCIDRYGYMSEDGAGKFGDKTVNVAADENVLTAAARAIEQAVDAIDSFPCAPSSASPNPMSFVLERVVAAEKIKGCLWKAKQQLKKFSIVDTPDIGSQKKTVPRLDYRLRYKTKVSNPFEGAPRRVRLAIGYDSPSMRGCVTTWDQKLVLPPMAFYETTIYPWNTDGRTENFLSAALYRPAGGGASFPGANPCVSITASIGLSQSTVMSSCGNGTSSETEGGISDTYPTVLFSFTVGDTAA